MEQGASHQVVEIIEPYARRGRAPKPRGRRVAIAGAVLVVAVAAAGAAYAFGWYRPALDRYNAATGVIKVKEGDTYAVEGAKVVLAGKSFTTDANGRADLAGITAGTYAVTVGKEGYADARVSLVLHRGANDVTYVSLAKLPDKAYAVKGFVQDYVSGKPVADVTVRLGGASATTDPSGAYAFANVPPGDNKVILSKGGYLDKELPVTVADRDIVTAQVPLVPAGRITFVSNRSGKRALYAADYDGSDQRAYVQPVGGTEDFAPLPSPDRSMTAFSSTRDGLKSPYGDDLSRLYVATGDGAAVTKVSDDVAYSFAGSVWSPDGKYLYYSGYADATQAAGSYKVYGTATGSLTDIGEAAYAGTFSPDGTVFAYLVNGYKDQPSQTVAADGTVQTTSTRVYVTQLKTVNLGNGERKTLATHQEGMADPAFTADGSAMLYDVTLAGARKTFQVTLADGSEKEVAARSQAKRTYAVSPDGTRKAFVEERDGKTDLYSVAADGGDERRLTTLGTLNAAYLPVWDGSGSYLVFAVRKQDETALYVAGVAGGEPKKITDYDDAGSYAG